MTQRIIIDGLPVTPDKRTDEQQKGRLRLVEIGNQLVHDMEGITRLDHDLRLRVQRLLPRRVHPVYQRLQGLLS